MMYKTKKHAQQAPAYRAFPRKLLATSTALLAGVPMLCSALGLGEMHYQSYLGQPLKAEIDLVNLPADIDRSNLKIRQVGGVEAEKLGVEILSNWHRFDFEVDPGKGEYQISLQSQRPINEPYLNFLIELAWPQGTLYREYTVFLDPAPMLAESEAEAKNSVTDKRVANRFSKTDATQKSSPTQTSLRASGSGEAYRVASGDTLYGIAQNLNVQESTANTAQWIFDNNPQAFVAGDMNRLIAGSELHLPQGAVSLATATNRAPAQSNLSTQPNTKREGRVVLDAPLKVEGEAQLADLRNAQSGDIQEQLQTNRAVLDYLVKENRDLKDRLNYLESSEYLSTLKQLVALQQSEIADLRAQLQEQKPGSLISSAEKFLGEQVQAQPERAQSQSLERADLQARVATAAVSSSAELPIAKAGLSPALGFDSGIKKPVSPFWSWLSGIFVFGSAAFAAFLVWRSRHPKTKPAFTATRDVEPSKPAFVYKDGREEISIDEYIDRQSKLEIKPTVQSEEALVSANPIEEKSEPRFARDVAEKVQQERARVADLQQRIKEKTSDYAQRKAERQQEPKQVEEIEIDPELENYLKF